MIEYLSKSDKNKTRKIWENIFKEDTKEFLDYYYKHKTINNKIICKILNKEIVSMLHLNPYKISINNKTYESYYIVAVATLENHRKKGYMAEILNTCLNDIYIEKVPFVFLRPAKKEIYLPFDFEYIYNHNYLNLNISSLKEVEIFENDYQNLANFTNKFLENEYNTFCIRDYDYIKTLHQEVKSEQGNIIMLFDNDKFIGYYVYWGVKEKTTRAIFLDKKFTDIKETKPLVMARIINLYEFFKNFSLKANYDDKISLCLNITDNIINKNNGLFRLNVSKHNSYIEPLTMPDKNVLDINIKDLISICFNYKPIHLFTKNDYILEFFSKINLLDKVFIDEEV
ncbi:GNAT family N-acetyltransferase [[Clostridium] colinum]|uniref:GNAT family N-acetyltransferase n=1 Tax=[Clostridium] colinum TaxID=36835 RepID=UPI002025594D|nr:GNAT family N-acetyltransferase [[Clostridium] colinum]